MDARARAMTARHYVSDGAAASRHWLPALIALCLGSWALALAGGHLIARHF